MTDRFVRAARPLRRALPLALLGAALAVAGCGGGDDDSDGPRELSHAALVRAANGFCERASAEIARLPVAASIEELGSYAERVGRISERLYFEISRLVPTQPDSAGFNRYVGALRTSNEQLTVLARAADANDRAGVSGAAAEIARAQVGTYAAVVGFDVCAQATPTPES